jgi:hypothetical protein
VARDTASDAGLEIDETLCPSSDHFRIVARVLNPLDSAFYKQYGEKCIDVASVHNTPVPGPCRRELRVGSISFGMRAGTIDMLTPDLDGGIRATQAALRNAGAADYATPHATAGR